MNAGIHNPYITVLSFLSLLFFLPTFTWAGEAAEPTAEDMLMIYELNRARANPSQYQTENKISVDLSSITPQPPLAVNQNLVGSARFHAEEMADNDYFGHTSQVTGDMPNKMARDHGYPLNSSFGDEGNGIESIAAGTNIDGLEALVLLIEDKGVVPPGHRIHLLATAAQFQRHREVGIGKGFNSSSTFKNYWAIHTGYENESDNFLTGVVFKDSNGNGRFDLNEGISGVTVSDGTTSTTTNSAGGWAIKVADGNYTVTASGGTFSGTGTATAVIAGKNVEVDFISGNENGIVDFEQDSSGGSEDSNSNTDTDGDGFTDELETTLGTTPTDSASTPFDGNSSGTAQSLTLTKIQIKLNFAKPSSDDVNLTGTIQIPADFPILGKEVTVDVGGIIKTFTLDEKGRSPKGVNDSFQVRIKSRRGVIEAQEAKFKARFKKGDFANFVSDENLKGTSDLKKVTRTVIVQILFNSTLFKTTTTPLYTARSGKKGTAKANPLRDLQKKSLSINLTF